MENNLKELRQKQNLTQEELAQILNITRQTIIAIERNKYDPTLRLALKIAQFFETDIEKIFKL
jgi:putative transcriptional regulator